MADVFESLGISEMDMMSAMDEMRASAAKSESSDWKSVLLANVQSLSELHAGWDGPGSVPVGEKLLLRAVFCVETALTGLTDVTAPRLVPGGDGCVQIEWHSVWGEIKFDIDDEGQVWMWGRDHLRGFEFHDEGEAALALLYEWAPLIAARRRDPDHGWRRR